MFNSVSCPHFSIGPASSTDGTTVTFNRGSFRCSICDALAENLLPEGERFAITAPDPQTGARYLFLTKYKSAAVRKTVCVGDSINVDLDENGDVIGVELL